MFTRSDMDVMKTTSLVVLMWVTTVTQGDFVEHEIVSMTKGSFSLTSEAGISPLGRNSLIFKVKSCGGAILALSDIVGITKNNGRYFMIYIGKKRNTLVSIQDSCFGCAPKKSITKRVLDCDVYKPFWVTWDGTKSLKFGEGLTLGEKILLDYTTDRPFPIRFSLVTTIRPPNKWKFLLQKHVEFTAPLPDGSSTVSVKEDVAVGSVVYTFESIPNTDLMMITESPYLMVTGNELRTKDKLDFETEEFVILRFRAKQQDVNLTLTLLVEDVNDETPEVVLGEGVHIPEELPVGFIIGGVFTATDRDDNDNLTYSLEGDDSRYLGIVGMGLMRVERRIDRDGPNGRTKLDKLTLGVVDAAHHKSTFSLTIIVTDINDNVPTCASGFFSKTIKPGASSDHAIMNIPCTDDDDGSNGQFSLRIVPSAEHKDYRKKFWLAAFDLFADVDTLRRESSRKESSVYILTILAVDTPKQGRANTGTAVVIINLPHRKPSRVNDYKPHWRSPVLDKNHNFPSVTVPESTHPGTVVSTFVADDKDLGTMVAYMIASMTNDRGTNVTGPFTIDLKTGQLRTTSFLDCDLDTGGVNYYTILVMATDGEHIISGYLKVIVKNSNDNAPVFNRTLHTVSVKTFKNFAVPLLAFDVHDLDSSSAVTLDLGKEAHRYFRLSKDSSKWLLKFRPGIDPHNDTHIPPVITVTANDNGDPPLTSEATVVLTDLPCHVTTPSQLSGASPKHSSEQTNQGQFSRTTDERNTQESSNQKQPVLTFTQNVKVGAEDYIEGSQEESVISNVPELGRRTGPSVCQPSSASQQDSRTGLYLKVACAVEGLIIVMTVLLVLAKRCGCLKKSSSAEHPERKEPLGCETALHGIENSSKQTGKKTISKSHVRPGPSCSSVTPTPSQLDVINEVPEPVDGHGNESPSGGLMADHKMTMAAKNKFLRLRRKEAAASPVQIYSDSTGVNLYDNEMVSVARAKFVGLLKEPSPQVDSEAGEVVYVAKDKFLGFLKKSPSEAPEIVNDLDSRNSDIVAIAKDKFFGLTKHNASTDLDLSKEAPPLDVMSLLDGSCFNCSEDAMVAVDKHKFLDMLKDSQTQNTFLTSNDAILANASGFDPRTNIVYIAKEKFFNLVRNREQENESDEMLVLPRANVMELIRNKIDPWAEQKSAVMQFVSGIDGESGETFMTKKAFLDLVNSNIEDDNNTDDMVAVTKPKLAELLQKNSENPKCNETLNYYVKAVSPASGIVYVAKKKFLGLSKPEEGPGSSDDVLEVEKDHLGTLMESNGADPASVETALKQHSLGSLPGTKRVYVAKSRFLAMTSASGKGSNIDVEENEMLEVSKDTIDDMSESAGNTNVPVIAVNEEKGSVFISKNSFLELSSYDYEGSDMIVLTKEKAAEIADPDEDKETFLRKHALAFTPATGKVYVARAKFVSMMKEKQLKSENSDPEGDELVSVPREQLTEMLSTAGSQRASSFIRAHAEAFNPATGAVFMARRKFLDVSGALKVGKQDDEVITVAKEKLAEIAHERGYDHDLSKLVLAFSGDNNTAFIAKSKFLKLSQRNGGHRGEDSPCNDGLVAIPEESLVQLTGSNEHSTEDLVKQYATAFNPSKKIAYVAKDKFLNMAKRMKSADNNAQENEELIALPKEKLAELTAGDQGSDKERLMKHALAFNDSQGVAYVAKSKFMKLMEDKHAGLPENIDTEEKEMVSVSQDQLEQMVSDGYECDQKSAQDAIKRMAIGFNPLTKTVYMARKKFTEIARTSVNSAGNVNNDNDIVTVSESQVAEIMKQECEKGQTSQLLQKHALAFNQTGGKVYFLKKKFKELAANKRKGKHQSAEIEESLQCDSFMTSSRVGSDNMNSSNQTFEPSGVQNAQTLDGCNMQDNAECGSLHDKTDKYPESSRGSQYDSAPVEDMSQSTVTSEQTVAPNTVSTVSEPMNAELNTMLRSGEFNVLDTRDGASYWDGAERRQGENIGTSEGVLSGYDDSAQSDESDDSEIEDSSGDSQIDSNMKRPRVVLTVTDSLDEDELREVARKQLVTPQTSMYGRLPTRDKKKKKKIKAWDQDVRNRLYGTASKTKGGPKEAGKTAVKKAHKGKSKITLEKSSTEISDLGGVAGKRGKKRKKLRKGSQIHPELETLTSETDDSVRTKTKPQRKKRSKHK